MTESFTETIAAIATPPGLGGVGVVRVSGPEAERLLQYVFERRRPGAWQSHRLYLGEVHDPQTGALIDTALAVLMRAPHSYTREDVVELQCHGGSAVLNGVLRALIGAGARLAERGEFTLRAFLNGALSLAEAEAVADLVAAKTSGAVTLAARQLGGGLRQHLEPLEKRLLDLLAAVTVAVDFPDDQDVPPAAELARQIAALRREFGQLLATAQAGRVYREGLSVVLAGATNVGKSSLLNRLLQSERAIVSAGAGTTRDIIEENFDLDGLPLVLRDTAGLREAAQLDEAEAIGMERSRAALELAQVVLIVIDAARGFDDTARELLAVQASQPERPCLAILNKADLVAESVLRTLTESLAAQLPRADIVPLSAKTGQGLDRLLERLKEKALGASAENGREPLLSNVRHEQAIRAADVALAEAEQTLAAGLPLDLLGVDLERAWQSLGEISGKTAAEEVITNIFANFCVGK